MLFRSMVYVGFQYTVAMMGYGPEDKNAALELTYNYGVTNYDKGNGYAQVESIIIHCFQSKESTCVLNFIFLTVYSKSV